MFQHDILLKLLKNTYLNQVDIMLARALTANDIRQCHTHYNTHMTLTDHWVINSYGTMVNDAIADYIDIILSITERNIITVILIERYLGMRDQDTLVKLNKDTRQLTPHINQITKDNSWDIDTFSGIRFIDITITILPNYSQKIDL